nr:outer membrane lipoprotein carrier protein LolA [Pseudohoeflea suaedae]
MLGAAASLMLVPFSSVPADAQNSAAAQRIANHFSSVKSMAGEFVQFGPKGEQTGGKFFLSRPGKLRFNYEAPASIYVISDGKSVAVRNEKLKTWEMYPLSSTPLKLLLSNQIDLSQQMVKDVKEDPDLITIVLGDKSVFGNSTISMMFDPKSYELKQWTIRDAQGKDTSVMIYNVQTGVNFDNSAFTIPYNEARPGGTMRN